MSASKTPKMPPDSPQAPDRPGKNGPELFRRGEQPSQGNANKRFICALYRGGQSPTANANVCVFFLALAAQICLNDFISRKSRKRKKHKQRRKSWQS